MIPDRAMRWMAIHFGESVEWNGPTVFGHGYIWCGRVWFPEQDNSGLLEGLEQQRRADLKIEAARSQ